MNREGNELFRTRFALAVLANLRLIEHCTPQEDWKRRQDDAITALAILDQWLDLPEPLTDAWRYNRPEVFADPVPADLERVDRWLEGCIRLILEEARLGVAKVRRG